MPCIIAGSTSEEVIPSEVSHLLPHGIASSLTLRAMPRVVAGDGPSSVAEHELQPVSCRIPIGRICAGNSERC